MTTTTTTITPGQIRAARALLNWSQNDLSQQTGISQASIANIETGKHRPNESSQTQILKALTTAGIELIDGGVRLRPDSLDIIDGPDFTARMPTIYFETMQRYGAEEVLINGVDFTVVDYKTRKAVEDNIARLQAAGKKQRILVRAGTLARDIIGPAEWHRTIPAEIFSAATPSFIYHDRFAVMLLDKEQILIIRNGNLADYQRRQFDYLWNAAKPLAV